MNLTLQNQTHTHTESQTTQNDFLTVEESLIYYKIKSRTTLDSWARDPSNPIEKETIGGRVYFSKVKILFRND